MPNDTNADIILQTLPKSIFKSDYNLLRCPIHFDIIELDMLKYNPITF
jgi:hypothetical protein